MINLKWAVALASFSILTTCGGTMQGVVRGTGAPVKFSYEQGMTSDTLNAVIGNESFKGKSVQTGASSTYASGITTGYGRTANTSIFGSSSTGAAVATLLGSKGSTLTCQLQYADTTGLTTMGGVGVCRHSDGRVIDVVW